MIAAIAVQLPFCSSPAADVPTWLAVSGAIPAAGAALWQLRLQRIQLADQTRIQEREQANNVDVTVQAVDGAQAKMLPEDKGEPVHMVVVTNGSARPIREVTAKVEVIRLDGVRFGKPATPTARSRFMCPG